MIDAVFSVINSATVMSAFLGVLWVLRHNKRMSSFFGIFAIAIFCYSIIGYANSAKYGEFFSLVSDIFILLCVYMNVRYTQFVELTLKLDRRKEQIPITFPERRKKR